VNLQPTFGEYKRTMESKVRFWRRQCGYMVFAIVFMGFAAFVMWLVLMEQDREAEQAQQRCWEVKEDSNVLELPPSTIVAPAGTEVYEL